MGFIIYLRLFNVFNIMEYYLCYFGVLLGVYYWGLFGFIGVYLYINEICLGLLILLCFIWVLLRFSDLFGYIGVF